MKTKILLLALFLVMMLISGGVAAANPEVEDNSPKLTITDGDATFSYTGATSAGTEGYEFPNSSLSIAGLDFNSDTKADGNQLYQTWWWYRVEGDGEESILPQIVSSKTFPGNNTAILAWDNVDGKFSVELVITIAETTAGEAATLRQDLTVTNLTDAPLNINFFVFADIDAGGTFGGDSAELNTTSLFFDSMQSIAASDAVNVRDSESATQIQFATNFESRGAFAVESWSDVSNRLTDTTVDNFDNQILPYPDASATGDFTSAVQDASRTIPAGQSHTYTAGFGVNSDAPTAIGLSTFGAATHNNAFLWPFMFLCLAVMTVALFVQSRRQIRGG